MSEKMTIPTDTEFRWHRLVPVHVLISVITFLVYFAPTAYLHLRGLLVAGHSVPPWWFLLWGYSFGLGIHFFTPRIWRAYYKVKHYGR